MREFDNYSDFIDQAAKQGVSIGKLAIEYEAYQQGKSEEEVKNTMTARAKVMMAAVQDGLQGRKSLSGLVGGAGKQFVEYMADGKALCNDFYGKALAYSLAANEANACMGRIVASPTAGSCGIMPGIFLAAKECFALTDDQIVEGLFTAGAVGVIIGKKACFAGAEGGCQAECGSAAAMSAVALASMLGCNYQAASDAGAIVFKSLLGLVCDPVAGLVEVPCVKRNAASALMALMAVDMVRAGITSTIPLDETIDAMGAVGSTMPAELRETARGGLAVTPTGLAIAERVFGEKS